MIFQSKTGENIIWRKCDKKTSLKQNLFDRTVHGGLDKWSKEIWLLNV